MKKVYNGSIERLIRTLGFILIGLSSVFLLTTNALAIDIKFINELLAPVNQFLVKNIEIMKYLFTTLAVGFLLLLFTQSRNTFLKILTTTIGVLTIVIYSSLSFYPYVFAVDLSSITFIKDLLQDLFTKFNWLKMVLPLVSVLMLYFILGNRKPEKKSLAVTASGILILAFSILMIFLPELFESVEIFRSIVYLKITYGFFTISYFLLILGSVMGILGVFFK